MVSKPPLLTVLAYVLNNKEVGSLIYFVKIKHIVLNMFNKPGFGVGFGGAGRVGTTLIIRYSLRQ